MKKRERRCGTSNGGLFRVKARANALRVVSQESRLKKASWTSIIALDNWKHSIKMAQISQASKIRPQILQASRREHQSKDPKLLKIRVSKEISNLRLILAPCIEFNFEVAKATNVKIGMIAKSRRSIDRGYKERGRYDPACKLDGWRTDISVCGQCKIQRRTNVVLRYEEAWTFLVANSFELEETLKEWLGRTKRLNDSIEEIDKMWTIRIPPQTKLRRNSKRNLRGRSFSEREEEFPKRWRSTVAAEAKSWRCVVSVVKRQQNYQKL